jgi:transaldolase
VDDWLKEAAGAGGIIVDPEALELAGVAVFKNAYRIFKERGYKTRLLSAAYRNHYHWSRFIGGEVSMTIPPNWIRRFVNSGITCENRMDDPVEPRLVRQLHKHFPDFTRAYEPDGMTPEEFDNYGATRKTLIQFLKSYDDMVGIIRNFMIESTI